MEIYLDLSKDDKMAMPAINQMHNKLHTIDQTIMASLMKLEKVKMHLNEGRMGIVEVSEQNLTIDSIKTNIFQYCAHKTINQWCPEPSRSFRKFPCCPGPGVASFRRCIRYGIFETLLQQYI